MIMQVIEKYTKIYHIAYNIALKGVFSKLSVGLCVGVLTLSKTYKD